MVEKRQGNGTPKRAIPIWFVTLVVLLLGFAFFGERGVLQVYKAYLQKTELEAKISNLEQSNAEMRKEIDALRNDLKTIESIARRELGMVRPDELVYQFHSAETDNRAPRHDGSEDLQSGSQAIEGRVDPGADGG